MSRTVLQTRTIIPLLRTSLLSKLSSDLVACTSRPVSACVVCGNARPQSNQTRRDKILAVTKTQIAGFSTKENQYPVRTCSFSGRDSYLIQGNLAKLQNTRPLKVKYSLTTPASTVCGPQCYTCNNLVL